MVAELLLCGSEEILIGRVSWEQIHWEKSTMSSGVVQTQIKLEKRAFVNDLKTRNKKFANSAADDW